MKQEIPTAGSKASTFTPLSATRARVLRTKESARGDSPGSKARPKLSTPDASSKSRVRRAILPNKPKQAEENIGAPEEKDTEDSKIADQPQSRTVEQYAKVRRKVDTNSEVSEYQNDNLLRRLNASESTVKELQSEVSALKAQLENLQSRNFDLETQNKRLAEDLSSAEAKIKDIEKHDQVEATSKEAQDTEFKDLRELIANKLDLIPVKREVTKGVQTQPKVQLTAPPPAPSQAAPVPGPPPPPPPPPPHAAPSRANAAQKAPALVEFYHSITKQNGKRGLLGRESCSSPVASKAHNSIVDELQNRSAHLLAIKADVENKGDFINHLIKKVQSAAFADIEDVPSFVDWLDGQLCTLADERAVLKHFNWPEKKADALREAAFEYRDLKRLLVEVSSFEDDISITCEATLKKATTLLDKSERSIQRLIKSRGTTMFSYKGYKIPIEWMLDPGIVCQIKRASTKLAKVYLKRVSTELELLKHTERESVQETLLLNGVRFAYRTYQLAGGLDSETMRAFEELRERIQ